MVATYEAEARAGGIHWCRHNTSWAGGDRRGGAMPARCRKAHQASWTVENELAERDPRSPKLGPVGTAISTSRAPRVSTAAERRQWQRRAARTVRFLAVAGAVPTDRYLWSSTLSTRNHHVASARFRQLLIAKRRPNLLVSARVRRRAHEAASPGKQVAASGRPTRGPDVPRSIQFVNSPAGRLTS